MSKPNGHAEEIPTPKISLSSVPASTPATADLYTAPKLEFKIVTQSPNNPSVETEFVLPESLYTFRHGTTETLPSGEIKLLEIRKICKEALGRLDEAFQETDPVARESVLTLFNDAVFRLGHFIAYNATFGRAVTLLHTAVIQSLSEVYSERQILALRRCLRLMEDNVHMSDAVLRECVSIVCKDGGFDLSAPTADATYYDDETDE